MKFLTILFIPLIITLSLLIIALLYLFKHNENSIKDDFRTREAISASRIIHALQIERGATAAIMSTKKDKKDLNVFKGQSNEAISNAKLFYIKNNKTDEFMYLILENLEKRNEFDLMKLSIIEAKDFYSKHILMLTDFIKIIPKETHNDEVRKLIQSFNYLLIAKENLGQIRALLNEELNTGLKSQEKIKQHLKEFYYNIEIFNKITYSSLSGYYKNINDDLNAKRTFDILDKISRQEKIDIEQNEWFEISTKTINFIQKTENEIFLTINQILLKEQNRLLFEIKIIILFLFIIIISLIALTIIITKKLISSSKILENNYTDSMLNLEQYKSAVDRSFIVSKTNAEGIITYVNDEFCKISGYSRPELIGNAHSMIRNPIESPEKFKDLWHTIKDLKLPWHGEIRNLTKDGECYWVKSIINPILDANNNVLEYIAIRADITQQKKIILYFEEQLHSSVKNFNEVLNQSKEYNKAIELNTGFIKIDLNGIVTYVNELFLEKAGLKKDEILNQEYIFSYNTEQKAEILKSIYNGHSWSGIIDDSILAESPYFTNTAITPIRDIKGIITEFLIFKNDISEIFSQKKELEMIYKKDQLTGFCNRNQLSNDLKARKNMGLAIFNIDNFRQINDFYGQEYGDEFIKSVTFQIYNLISSKKHLSFYKLQGDEFAILNELELPDEFEETVNIILKNIKELKFNEEIITISCTCGISYEDNLKLLSSANMALKTAKKNNIDYVVYDEQNSLNNEYQNNLKWTKKLSKAIHNNDIITFYQPIVNNKTGDYEKYESLIRMKDDGNVISPFFFLEIAKQTKQYFNLTKIVIFQSFEKFEHLNKEFSINLSIKDILDQHISEYIILMLQKYKIGSRVVFEIVESEYIENFEGVLNFISKVKEFGCKVAIDDFGTGYSNFEYLIKLKADYLKIDGSLIKNIDKDNNSLIVVSTIVEFSKRLGMKTIAEFVENENIFNIVKELGIDYSQGYYFSAPKLELSSL